MFGKQIKIFLFFVHPKSCDGCMRTNKVCLYLLICLSVICLFRTLDYIILIDNALITSVISWKLWKRMNEYYNTLICVLKSWNDMNGMT